MIKNILAIILLISLFQCYSYGQQHVFTLSGNVVDQLTGEPLVGAVVKVKDNILINGLTDNNGQFTLQGVKTGAVIICEYIGYKKNEKTFKHKPLKFSMEENTRELNELKVSDNYTAAQQLSIVQAGVTNMDLTNINKMPVLFGERDIVKSLQLMPGVKSEGDGSSNFMVRGGTASQNLILLDDAPVNTSGHLMGFFSAFNTDILRDVTLYKGQMPAQYGGRCSSVLDIKTKEGDLENYHFNGNIGLISAKIEADGPIKKNKASFAIAARRTYEDIFLGLDNKYKGTQLYFYDINAKVSYQISKKDKITSSFFEGKDVFSLNDIMKVDWSNINVSVKWRHVLNNKLSSNLTAVYSDYTSKGSMQIFDINQSYGVGVMQSFLKEEMIWTNRGFLKPTIRIGLQSSLHNVKSGEVIINSTDEKEDRKAWENAAWLNAEGSYKKLSVTAGIRAISFSILGGNAYTIDSSGEILSTREYKNNDISKTYYNIEPRISINYHATSLSSIKAAYSCVSQNVHSLVSGPTSSMFDRYTISTTNIKPEIANQLSFGYFHNLKDNKYEMSAEIYYKTTENVLNYRDGENYISHIEIERLLLSGKSKSYGLELCAKKNTGRLTGWISYTLSRSETKIDGINKNKWYVSNNDRTNDFSIVMMYNLNKRWNLAATWVFSTGQPYTLPCGRYTIDKNTVYLYEDRNNSRTKDYHRLDISATYQLKTHRKYHQELTFGIYNVYNRYNPYMIILNDNGTASQYSMFGIVPSVSYNFKF